MAIVTGINSPYWYGKPLTQITPFTLPDGATYERKLDWLYNYITNTLVPEVNTVLADWYAGYKADHEVLLADIQATKDGWQALFEQFMADVTAQIAILNDAAVSQLVESDTSVTHGSLVDLITANSSDATEVDAAIFDQLTGVSAVTNRLYPQALAKVKAIYADAIEAPVYNIFLGSSTTNGAFSSEGMSYPAQLTRKVGASLPLRSDPVLFLLSECVTFKEWEKPGLIMGNAGVGGRTSRNFYGSDEAIRINTVLGNRRGVVTMMIGSNDQNLGYSPTEYQANVAGAIADIKTKAPKGVAFILVHSFARADKITYPYAWDEYRDALFAIADADPENVMTVDLDRHYKLLDVMGVDQFGFGSGDLVHNNEKSHTFTAEYLGKYLELTDGGGKPAQSVTMVDSFTDVDGVTALSHTPDSWAAGSGVTIKANDSKWSYGTGTTGFNIMNNNLASLGTHGLLYTDTKSADHSVSARIIYGSPGTRGVFCRYDPVSNSRLSFYVAGANVVLSRTSDSGSNVEMMKVPADFVVGADFTLSMECVGRRVSCYFNGDLKISLTLGENIYGLHNSLSYAGLRATEPGELYSFASAVPLAEV